MMHDLTAFQRDILYVLAGLGEPAGVDVKEELDEYYEGGVMYSRLYQNLNQLVDMGLVEKGKKDDRTNEYSLTDEGREMLARHDEWKQRYFSETPTDTEGDQRVAVGDGGD